MDVGMLLAVDSEASIVMLYKSLIKHPLAVLGVFVSHKFANGSLVGSSYARLVYEDLGCRHHFTKVQGDHFMSVPNYILISRAVNYCRGRLAKAKSK